MKTKTQLAKRILAVLLSFIMAAGLMPEIVMNVSAAAADFTCTIDTGKSVTLKDTDGDGYYEIRTADELYAFSVRIRENYRSINAELMNDIVFNENVVAEMSKESPDISGFRRWHPIGYYYYRPFNGIFDGNGKNVSGLFHNGENDEQNCYRGMFGSIEDGSVVKNLNVTDSYFYGEYGIGAIVGQNENSTVENCSSSNNIVDGVSDLGGIVGINSGTVKNCHNSTDFIGDACYIGGIVGSNSSLVNSSYNFGSIECDGYAFGDLVGMKDSDSSINNSYYLSSTDDGIGGKTAAQFESGEVAYLLQSGVDAVGDTVPQVWGQNIDNGSTNEGRPVFSTATVNYGYADVSCAEISPYTNKTVVTTERLGHEYENSVCTVCKKVCLHTNSTKHYSDNDDTHSLICSVCKEVLETSGHNFVNGICDKCEEKKDYTVTVSDSIQNGTVTVDKEIVNVGDTVTLSIEADKGYELKSITVTYGEGNTVNLSDNSFVMPAADVNINASFYQICFHIGNTDTDEYYDYHSFTCAHCGKVVTKQEHYGGTATCNELAKCDVCGDEYGYIDYYNHTGPFEVEYEWHHDILNDSCHVNAYLYCRGCDVIKSSDYGYAEKIASVPATNCMSKGSETWSFTVELDGVEYTKTKTFEIKSDNHTGTINNGFCSDCGGFEAARDSDEDGYYEIDNAGKLYWYAQYLNTENAEIYAKLTKDIEIPENAPNWEPINASYVYFNGNYHTISGLKCIGGDRTYVGLFGNEIWWYEISNLHITDSYFEGAAYVGALVGCMSNGGTITNCYVTNTTVKGDSSNVGGLVGYLGSSNMYNCYSTAKVEGEYAKVLVGYHAKGYGEISNCYYLSETETEDGGKTAAQFASGEVAFLLQSGVDGELVYDEDSGEWVTLPPAQIWGQNIGSDNYPVFGGDKVYLIKKCDGVDDLYSNLEIEADHDFEEGVCTVCGTVEYDVNNDKTVNMLDLISLKNNLLNEAEYDRIADINSDGIVNLTDFVKFKKILFKKF